MSRNLLLVLSSQQVKKYVAVSRNKKKDSLISNSSNAGYPGHKLSARFLSTVILFRNGIVIYTTSLKA